MDRVLNTPQRLLTQKPNIKYRKYKHFNKNKFEKEILNKLSKCNKKTF